MGADTDGWRRLERDAALYAVRRTWHGFIRHRGIDQAAALTFFLTLTVFPSLLAFTSVFSLFEDRQQALERIVHIIDQLAPRLLANAAEVVLRDLLSTPNPVLALLIAVAIVVWAGSGYVMAFGRAVNTVYETVEGRRYASNRVQAALVAILLVLCVSAGVIMVLATPRVASDLFADLGWPQSLETVWQWLKWPLIGVDALFIVAVLHYAAPNIRRERIRWLSLGAVFTILVWAGTSALYLVYVDDFADYDRLYGFLAGIIVTLFWLYLTNLVLVLGVEADAELLRARQLLTGTEAEVSIAVAVRTTYRNQLLARRTERDERTGRELRARAIALRDQTD